MGNNDDNRIIIQSTGWKQLYAYLPVKLINGKWIWFKPFFTRAFIGVNGTGFFQKTEFADIFYVMANPDNAIFSPEMWKNECK